MFKRPCRSCGGYYDPDTILKGINKQYCSKACHNEDIYSTDYSPTPLPDLSDGACVGYGTDAFFSQPNGTVPHHVKKMCASCPVLQACGEYGIRVAVEGVWGGMGNKTRANIAKNKGIIREPLTFDYILQMQFTRSEDEYVG